MNNLLIGITTDYALAEPGRDARFFLKSSYVNYFLNGGAQVVLLPFSRFFDPEAWTFLDGIVLSGSGPDIPPHFYGTSQKFFPGTWMVEDRVNFEFSLLGLCESIRMPVLGICGGFQTMNVYRGGSLIQDIPTMTRSPVNHQESEHPVDIRLPWPEGEKVDKSSGPSEESPVREMKVNSFHHQGIDRVGSNLDILAVSKEDQLVEGFHDPRHPFFAGVQWHPERMPEEDPLSQSLRKAFLESCLTFRKSRS